MTASIHRGARLGSNVEVGDFSVVHADVELGDNVRIGSHCIVGEPTPLAKGAPLVIGAGALVRSHSVLYAGSRIEDELVTGHHVVVRENSRIGRRVQLGTFTELQGDLEIGAHTRMQSSVFVPKHSTIGSFVWLLPGVCLTNDPHPPSDPSDMGVIVEDYAVLAARAVVLPGIRIGTHALVGAGSVVTRNVEPGTVVAGVPARVLGRTQDIKLRDGGGAAYPWTRHFHRGYPAEIVTRWLAGEEP